MTHGVGNTMSWFSTICKDFASQGHIVFSVEHNDKTALHFYSDKNESKYFQQIDMRNMNKFIQKLGIRSREINGLIDEIPGMAKNSLS
jgi:Platelet-activating factor acetylhydrolase, isoform II